MYLTNREKEFLLVTVAGRLAKERREKGLKLNYPEAIALLSCEVFEAARMGNITVEQLENEAKNILSEDDVMEGVPAMIDRVDIEATFPDGTKLVVLYNPISSSYHGEQGSQGSQGGGQSSGQQSGPQHSGS